MACEPTIADDTHRGPTLRVRPKPCNTCPYRTDTPPGIWDAEEYEKLRGFAAGERIGIFMCHHSVGGPELVCRGWLSVEAESAAARIAVLEGRIVDDDRYADPGVELYPSGAAAADAGIAGVQHPGPEALRAGRQIVAERRRTTRRQETV